MIYGFVACAAASFLIFYAPIPTIIFAGLGMAFLIMLIACGLTLLVTSKKEGFFEKFHLPLVYFMSILLVVMVVIMARPAGLLYGTLLIALMWGLPLSVIIYAVLRPSSRSRQREGPSS